MINEFGSYNVPVTLKQLEASSMLDKENKPTQESNGTGMFNSFGNILKKQMNETNELAFQANKAKEILATGGNIQLHEVMLKAEKAETAMQFTLKMRNKLVEAYKEIQNIRV